MPTADFPGINERLGTMIGPYKLMEKIGEGGFGLVFVAEQTEPVKRKVALKVIKPGMDSKQVIARFEAERQALAMMDHPNIARVLDAGTTETGRPYFVMELVRGIPITDYCDQNHLTPAERLELFVSVCHAIQHAHQKGIIHRDIKPSNVLVTSHDGKPVAKVIDFGVAKAIHQHLTERSIYTQFAQMIGTPLYMSPEQAEMSGLDIDTRSDIYSLGVLLYELLTGSTPLERKRLAQAAYDEIRRAIREEDPQRPSDRLSTSETLPSLAASRKTEPARLSRMLKGELDCIVLKALEKDRTRRYETASGFARDIQRYLSDEVVEARPASTGYRLRKFIARNKGQVIAALIVFLALLAGIGGTTGGLIEAKRQELIAREEAEAKEHARRAEAEQRSIAEEHRTKAEQAKVQVETALQESNEARRQSDAVTSYLVKLLRSADPRMNGRDVRLADLLDRAPVELDANFPDSPKIKAQLLTAIGHTYEGLSLFANGAAMHEKALPLRLSVLGRDHPDTLNTMMHLADCYRASGRIEKAVALAKETFDLQTAKQGPNHAETLMTAAVLGNAYRTAGRMDEAIQLFEDSLKCCKHHFGTGENVTMKTMNDLAVAYRVAERFPEAVSLLKEALDAHSAKWGPDHLETLTVANNLAHAYRFAGQPNETVRLLEPCLKRCQNRLGADHPTTLSTMNNLAMGYQAIGRLPEAVSLFNKTLPLMEAKLGPDDLETLTLTVNLSETFFAARQPELALPKLNAALPRCKTSLGPDHRITITCEHDLAEAYESLGQPDKAEPLRLEIVASTRKNPGNKSVELAGSLAWLGRNYLQQKQFTKAEAVVQECLSIREKQDPNDWRTFNTKSLLGGALLGQKKYAEAEPMLLISYKGMKSRESTPGAQAARLAVQARLTEALGRLIQLYTETNKPEEVGKWQAEKDNMVCRWRRKTSIAGYEPLRWLP